MNYETRLCIKVAAFLFPIIVVALRLISILPSVNFPSQTKDVKSIADVPLGEKESNIMILLGSGGHTGEMMRILANVDLGNLTRTWVVSSGDTTSLTKAKDYEQTNFDDANSNKTEYLTLHRARKVGEPLLSSVKSTIKSFIHTLQSLRELTQLPSVLLLNGPGTSVPLAYILFGMKFLGLCKTRIIYIESLARVNSLSVSGLLLLPIADRFIVQWEPLFYKYKRAEYYGILI
ncbi:oligosaccharide biosynthesis protein Alg14 like-domain-containing protein [Scheffersomyces xylosifermentans]|uniref:oligosaccharide biosynthesis protein Alg14 like-domain-containing protein n=1 Tax=Scheffersomyces xylosifermentans TaxID=1304137 RepID=UPI00315C7883